MKKILAVSLVLAASVSQAQDLRFLPKGSGLGKSLPKAVVSKAGGINSLFHTPSLLSRFKPARLMRSTAFKAGVGLLAAGLILPACSRSDDDKQFSTLTVQNKTRRETLEIWLQASFGQRFYSGTLRPGESLFHDFFVDGADTIYVQAIETLSKEAAYSESVYLNVLGATQGVEDLQETAVEVFNQRSNDVILEMDDLDSSTLVSVVVPAGTFVYPVRGDRFYSIKVKNALNGTVLYFNPSQWFTGGQLDNPYPVVVN